MIFSFTIERPSDVITTFNNLSLLAEKHNAIFSGDKKEGHVSVSGVNCSYTVDEDIILVKVLKKPMLVPNRLIESEIRSIFREAADS